MKKIKKSLLLLFFSIIIQLGNPLIGYAMDITPYGFEEFRTCSNVSNYSNTMVSINPTIAANGIPNNVATVNYSIKAVVKMRYNRVTGLYVSTGSPTITLNYVGPVALTISSSSTSYRDNGSSITYTYNGNLTGTIVSDMGVFCTINYGKFKGSFTIKK